MATVDDAVAAGEVAADEAALRLLARGIDPARHERLLEELKFAVGQCVAAVEHGRRDLPEFRRRLDLIWAQIDADPVVDALPPPTRRKLAMRW